MSSSLAELENAMDQATLGIYYERIGAEPDPDDIPFLRSIHRKRVTLPRSGGTDPFAVAKKISGDHPGARAFILIPGRLFDLHGTRVGRGGGWFDRFLSAVPDDWIRIGVVEKSHVSDERLERKPWDEPMDWLAINDGDAWNVRKTFDDGSRTRRDTNRRTDRS